MDEVTNQLPSTGSFGSMSREQIIEMAKHPPKSGGTNADPLASVTASVERTAQQKAYHKTRDIVVTIAKIHAGTGKATVVKEDGSTFKASMVNLRML